MTDKKNTDDELQPTTVSPGTNAPTIVLLSLPSKILSFFSRKRSHFPPSGDPLLFSVMAGSGWPRVFRTTSRSPGFCGKRKAAKLHGLYPLKMPLFQKYGNKNIFSSGIGTPSTAEFPGLDPPRSSPSVNRSGVTYSPVLLILYKRREYPERDPNPLPGARVPIPVRRQLFRSRQRQHHRSGASGKVCSCRERNQISQEHPLWEREVTDFTEIVFRQFFIKRVRADVIPHRLSGVP